METSQFDELIATNFVVLHGRIARHPHVSKVMPVQSALRHCVTGTTQYRHCKREIPPAQQICLSASNF